MDQIAQIYEEGGAITNTMIIPETETRTVSTIGGSVQLELGINGLIAARNNFV